MESDQPETGQLYHTPSLQGSGITAEAEAERLWEPEVVDICKKMVFVRHNKAIASMNSQYVWLLV